ncbi:MAG: hypothetical protein GC150_07770 [Rhizobiales bacterium]|nr:hypothetical protein [Hyphomicrobiales bacterium]
MRLLFALAMGAGLVLAGASAEAGGSGGKGPRASQHPQSDYYRGGPQVRGFRRSVGGYSYEYNDGQIDARDQSVFLDPELDSPRRDRGPFDSGFFFDSGIGVAIDDSPYLN